MEFLYKLYSNEYFGVILFTIIGILAFLFILILILGKIDEKKSKQAIKESEDAFKDVTPEAVALEAPVNVAQPVVELEPTIDEEQPIMEEAIEESPVEIIEEPEEVIEPITMSESDPFANSYLDLSEIERSLNNTIEEPQPKEEITFMTPDLEEKEAVTNITASEPAKVTPMPDQFSSVYVNHSVDVPTVHPEEENDAPDMEFELPKKVTETTSEAEPKQEEVPGLMIFPDIESETYEIHK